MVRELISKFEVNNLEEWREKFPQIKVTPVNP